MSLEKDAESAVEPKIVDFVDGDPENPRNWSELKKWGVNLTGAFCMMTGTLAVSSYSSGLQGMRAEFGVSQEVLAVGQTTYLLGLAFGSMGFPASADYFGRRNVILATMTCFTLFSIGVAAAKNIATVLVCRFFAGLFASAAQSLAPASVSALWPPHRLAVPFTTAAVAPFLGPSLGPLIGGYIVEYSGSWRNVDWWAMAVAGLFTLLFALFVPETYAPYILRRRAAKLGPEYVSVHDQAGRKSVSEEARVHLVRPFKYLATEPIVLIFTLYSAFLYGVLNLFFSSFPYIYRIRRGWSLGNSGLPFIALLVGFMVSVPVTMLTGRAYIKRVQTEGSAPPELRLIFAMLSAVLLPISLFWMGWTGAPGTPWPAPVVAGGVFGFCQIGLQMSIMTYLADVYGFTVGSAFAALNFVRFALASAFPLFALQMYERLGIGWASSVLGFILVVFLPAPFLFYHFGPTIRSWSPSAKK